MKILRLTPIFLDIETTGLSPIQTEKAQECEIVAIGIGRGRYYIHEATEHYDLEVEILSRDQYDEEDIILKALYNLISGDSNCIIGYNISFDLPFLTARYLKHGYDSSFVTRLRELYRVDLMYVVTRYLLPNSRHIKLKDIAAFLDLPYDDGISGADIPKLFEEGNFEAIKQHCQRDIETIYRLFFKLKDLCKHNIRRRYNLDLAIEFEGE
jgi:uncharacterized protein YprB with RNaseH-like and TPR domain